MIFSETRLFKIIAKKHTAGAFYRALAAKSLRVGSSVTVSAVSLLFVQAIIVSRLQYSLSFYDSVT